MEFISFSPSGAEPGDVLVLTKPLGTQLATNAMVWFQEKSVNWQKLTDTVSDAQIRSAYDSAVASMTFLNKTAAELMHKYKAHAATDVTGFGLFGHAKNLVDYQIASVDFHIHALPIIRHVREMAVRLEQKRLLIGRAVETSGGLLIALPATVATEFCSEFQALSGRQAWIVGSVTAGSKNVTIADEPIFIDAQ